MAAGGGVANDLGAERPDSLSSSAGGDLHKNTRISLRSRACPAARLVQPRMCRRLVHRRFLSSNCRPTGLRIFSPLLGGRRTAADLSSWIFSEASGKVDVIDPSACLLTSHGKLCF